MGEVRVHLAKTAGFCFGVARAVRICEELASAERPVVTLGPIIHNKRVISELGEKGVGVIHSLEEAKDAVVVIRSHGVPQSVYDELSELGLPFADATCPDVAAIQSMVREGAKRGKTVLIAGDPDHPEVIGIAGHAGKDCYVFETGEELAEKIFPETGDVPVLIVAQTTFNLLQYRKCKEAAKTFFSDVEAYETICKATLERQLEAGVLGARCDVCIVVGGQDSSNTKKLRDICGENAATYLVESKDELKEFMFRGAAEVGVTAGASTPAPLIEEVLARMDEIIKENGDAVAEVITEEISDNTPEAAEETPETGDDTAEEAPLEIGDDTAEEAPEETGEEAAEEAAAETGEEAAEETFEADAEEGEEASETDAKEEEFNFESALEDSLRQVHRNQRVVGVVTQIRPNEVVVDIGSKHTGIIPVEELSDDSSKNPEDIVSVGDKLNLLVIGTNDQEGITTLSKKRLDTSEGLDLLMAAADEGTVLDAYVTELVNKGLIAVVKGVRVFVPASHATLRYGASYDNLLRTNVRIKILEVNPARRRAIGSVRAVLQEELAGKREVFWTSVEVGKEYTGVVKSLTSYGAFVDLGGVDGMVHVSELSWQRVRNPSEVVSVGDEITVYVREIDRERRRISLGYRREADNPWKVFEMNYTIGDVFPAKVVSLTKFGAFVRIIPGIDGLVHISEISKEHIEKASDMLSVGDDVMVKLIDVENEKRRISLSMRYEGAPVLERKPGRRPARGEPEKTAVVEESEQPVADAAVAEAVEVPEEKEPEAQNTAADLSEPESEGSDGEEAVPEPEATEEATDLPEPEDVGSEEEPEPEPEAAEEADEESPV